VFDDQDIKFLMWALTPLPVMAALSATPVAVLRRSQLYKQLAVRSIAGLMIGGIIGIVAGLLGAGVWALALQVLTQRAAEFVIGWIAVPARLAFTWSARHFHEMRPVAANVFVARIMTFAGGQLPRIILGYTVGPTELGLYTLANRFLDVIVNTVIVPRALVGRIELRESEPGSPEFERTFSKMAQNISLLTFPILVGAASLTPDLFGIWLDQRWQAGVIPTQLMLLSGLPAVFLYCIDAALLAANLSSMFKWSAMIQTFSIIGVMLCASPFGLDVTCLMLAVRAWALLPFFFWWVQRACHLPVYGFVRQPVRALAGAIAMGVLLNLPVLRLPFVGQKFEFAFLIVVGVIFYGVFLFGFARSQLKSLVGGLVFHRS
jgi:PST family polysaccharide transporter